VAANNDAVTAAAATALIRVRRIFSPLGNLPVFPDKNYFNSQWLSEIHF
jgi:hypothetical protein